MQLVEQAEAVLEELGVDLDDVSRSKDMALGNGGLGRLASCFMDSLASGACLEMGTGFVIAMDYLNKDLLTVIK